MNPQPLRINKIIDDITNALEDKAFTLVPNMFVVVKKELVNELLDDLYSAIPEEIEVAKVILRKKEEVLMDAQQKADKILNDAQNEAARLLSESDLLRAVQKEAEKIKEQVIGDCEEIKRRALEEAENIRIQAADEAMRTKEGAEVYAEQVLTNLERDLGQLQQVVKNGQIYMEKLRAESGYESLKPMYTSSPEVALSHDFKIN